MSQKKTLQLLVSESSAKLRRAVAGLDDDLLQRRPGSSLNPIGFIYFHVLRSWDEDVSALCQQRPPEEDIWHRAGFSDWLRYEPLGRGHGGRGVGVGFSDDEVDAVPKRLDALSHYHDLLDAETSDWIEGLSSADFDRAHGGEMARSRGIDAYTLASVLRMIALHHAEHAGDIKFVKGMLGMPDPTYPGAQEPRPVISAH